MNYEKLDLKSGALLVKTSLEHLDRAYHGGINAVDPYTNNPKLQATLDEGEQLWKVIEEMAACANDAKVSIERDLKWEDDNNNVRYIDYEKIPNVIKSNYNVDELEKMSYPAGTSKQQIDSLIDKYAEPKMGKYAHKLELYPEQLHQELNRRFPSHGIENNLKEETKMAKEFKHEEWMDKAKASEKQLAFASKLGLKTEEMLDMTYAQAHEKIEERLKEPASEKQIARAKVLDVEIGENPTKCQLYGQMRKQYFKNQKLPATEKQIELAKKMHLEIGDNPTKGELSKMIGNAIEESEKKPATEKQIETCKQLGIEIGDEPKLRDLSRKIAEFNKNKELQDKSKENTDKDKSASLSKENEQSKEREQEKEADKGMER